MANHAIEGKGLGQRTKEALQDLGHFVVPTTASSRRKSVQLIIQRGDDGLRLIQIDTPIGKNGERGRSTIHSDPMPESELFQESIDKRRREFRTNIGLRIAGIPLTIGVGVAAALGLIDAISLFHATPDITALAQGTESGPELAIDTAVFGVGIFDGIALGIGKFWEKLDSLSTRRIGFLNDLNKAVETFNASELG